MRQLTLDDLNRAVAMLQRVSAMVIDDGKTAIAQNDHVAIITHFVQLRNVNATIKAAREALSELEDEFSRHHIPDVVAELREKTGQKPPFHIEGIGRVSVANKFSCTVLDRPKAHDWLRESGNGALVIETTNASTLASFAKDLTVNQGKSLPPDIFKVGTVPYTSITKE